MSAWEFENVADILASLFNLSTLYSRSLRASISLPRIQFRVSGVHKELLNALISAASNVQVVLLSRRKKNAETLKRRQFHRFVATSRPFHIALRHHHFCNKKNHHDLSFNFHHFFYLAKCGVQFARRIQAGRKPSQNWRSGGCTSDSSRRVYMVPSNRRYGS